jgi:type I restriction enzyme S subunit
MAEWISKTLGELTSFISKGIPPKYVDEENENTIRVLNQKCNRNFEISYNESRIHNAAVKKVPENKLLHSGDVLINSTGTGTAGRVAQIFNIPMPTTVDGHMILLRPTKEIDPLYYGYVIKSYQKKIESLAEGSTGQTEINRQRLQDEIYITFPKDRALQKEIGTFLFQIDEKIKNNSEINNNLEQQAQAIFKSWFVDFDPFGGNRPIDWITGIVDDLGAEIICGKTPSTKKKEYYGGNTPFITIPDMHGCVYNVSTERYLSAAGVASQPKKTLPHNTVCISCIGTAGLVTLVSEKSQSNQQINSIVPKEGISAYYIYLLMQTLSETINKLGQSGSTIVNLNKTQFGKIPVPIPSEQVLCNFDTLCKPLFEMILSNQKENIKLANLRDTLLPKLMAGELDVSDLDL